MKSITGSSVKPRATKCALNRCLGDVMSMLEVSYVGVFGGEVLGLLGDVLLCYARQKKNN